MKHCRIEPHKMWRSRKNAANLNPFMAFTFYRKFTLTHRKGI